MVHNFKPYWLKGYLCISAKKKTLTFRKARRVGLLSEYYYPTPLNLCSYEHLRKYYPDYAITNE